jgi:hypothetical protein
MPMFTIDRIERLLVYCGLPPLEKYQLQRTGKLRANNSFVTFDPPPGHAILNTIDLHLNVDTEMLPSRECECLWHIGKTCHARRAVGARLALLEEAMARDEITKQVKDLQEQYAYG